MNKVVSFEQVLMPFFEGEIYLPKNLAYHEFEKHVF